ncbi:FAD/NAD(P)-binding domain-containing protein [Gymnopus androsaceus JB14]|uniref:FAD/NAD(P)-binding domain-containing protein n=1 Tax=Gymnopus androsaceus JB14 TaxID=1447944 RepID=A0A6A4IE14_9AGAR|nr:FAD/NAD(P)-binding domain-containing protein [Gymnopus androsaceus JB14]
MSPDISERKTNMNYECHVAIVGGGISGIASGIALKRQLGFTNFTIYEKSSAVGGTWSTSTYPGCASDIPCHWYSLSSDLNPDWPSHFATQPQILAYWESVWRKHDLPSHTKFETSLYHVTIRDEKTGETSLVDAHFLIYGLGGFMAPQYPKSIPVEQLETFKGPVWHSAQWRHDVELKDKRVAVIGNGCSGAQIVPALSLESSTRVINFIRSPQWLVPMNNFQYGSSTKWIFRNFPFVMRWYRNAIMARADLEFMVFRKSNRRLREFAVKGLTSYIKSVSPEPLWDKLIPDYPVGAKQIIVDPKYLESLSRLNVELQTEPIECLVENGIKLKSGAVIEVDAIVFATGYSLASTFESEPTNLRVRGLNGKTIREYFDESGGPTAYLGSNFPGFPNLCYIIGANAATGHASLLFDMEAQIQLAIQLATPVIN